MKKINSLFVVVIFAVFGCGGSGGTSSQNPTAYPLEDQGAFVLGSNTNVYAETLYIHDFQGENYLLSCNSSSLNTGQLEIFKMTGGQFTSTEKMNIGYGTGCSGVAAVKDEINSVKDSNYSDILHIAATQYIANANYYVNYWCWDGEWSTGAQIEDNSAQSACSDYFNGSVDAGTPSMAIDQSSNTLWVAYQLKFNSPNQIDHELHAISYPLANIVAADYEPLDWGNNGNAVEITGQNGAGAQPVIRTSGTNVLIASGITNSGVREIELWKCAKTNNCQDIQNWSNGNTIVATNLTAGFDFEIDPSSGYLNLLYQSSDSGASYKNGLVYKEWSDMTPFSAGPEQLIATLDEPISVAAATMHLGIDTNGRKHAFWWDQTVNQNGSGFINHFRHSFEQGNIFSTPDIKWQFYGSNITDIPTNIEPVFDGLLSTHGDQDIYIGFSHLAGSAPIEQYSRLNHYRPEY